MDPSAKLLWLTGASVVGLVVLIARFKLNAFLALIVASLFVGVGSGMPLAEIAKGFQEGVGTTLGFIAVVVGLGTILGKMLSESGGAEVIAERFIALFGKQKLAWAFLLVAFLVGFPVFFGVGVVLLIPILYSLTRETKLPLLALGLPMVAGLSASHGLVPPHPGPMIAIDKLGADPGKTILYSVLVSIPAAIVAGPLFAKWIAHRVPLELGPIGAKANAQPGLRDKPSLGVTLFTILLPALLMLGSTIADLTLPKGNAAREWANFIGSPLTAMLAAVLLSLYTFGIARGFNQKQILKFTEDCVGPAATIFLVVGAGGGFSKVLHYAGVDDVIAKWAGGMKMSPLLLGWLVAGLIRVAVGSATVAITLGCAIMAPIAAAQPGINRELLVVALGAGSLVLSHLNDGGFWFVKEYFNMTVPQTLKTWTVLETILSVVALLALLLLNAVI